MGAPNDVASVDRLVRVIASTMVDACFFKENWPARCLTMVEAVGRELKPLLKTFGRPLGKELGIGIDPRVSGIMLKEWSFIPDKPRYVVYYSDIGWLLIRKPGGEVSLSPNLLADIIGDAGGMSLFVDACGYAVEELFRKRREKLDELEQNCYLRQMNQAFNPNSWPQMLQFLGTLKLG